MDWGSVAALLRGSDSGLGGRATPRCLAALSHGSGKDPVAGTEICEELAWRTASDADPCHPIRARIAAWKRSSH